MIKYNLKCENKHEFESWFSNSKEFEKLRLKKLVECIYCKSKHKCCPENWTKFMAHD